MAIIEYPSGLKIVTFPKPPSGFDPFQASEHTLLQYGLTHKLVHEPALRHRWERLFARTSFIEPSFERSEYKQHRPRIGRIFDTTETSGNWCGAVVHAPSGTTLTYVQGEWTVPFPSAPLPDGTVYFSASWIGLDGDGSIDVLQAGVEHDAWQIVNSPAADIYPWWEWFPETEIKITNFPVTAGDDVSFTVMRHPTQINRGSIFIHNFTPRPSIFTWFEVLAPTGTALVGNCAEWIVERPTVGGALSNLDNFGTVTFIGTVAEDSNHNSFSLSSANNVNMTDNSGNVIAEGKIEGVENLICRYG
jgi:hypothetical protein